MINVSDVCAFVQTKYQGTTPAEVIFILNINSSTNLMADDQVALSDAVGCWLFFELQGKGTLESNQLSLMFQTFGDNLKEICADITEHAVTNSKKEISNHYFGIVDRDFVTLTNSPKILSISTGRVTENDSPTSFIEGLTYNITKIVCDLLLVVKKLTENTNEAN